MKRALIPILLRIIPFLAVASLLYFFWFWKGSDFLESNLQGPSSAHHELVGKMAPDFTIPKNQTSSGREFTLDTLEGKPMILHFWATWCGPCILELPELIQLAKKRDLSIVAIAVDRDWKILDDFFTRHPQLKELRENSILLIDPPGAIASKYGVLGLPESVLLRKNHTIQAKLVGPQPWLSSSMAPFLDRLSVEN